jgi:hypothetical protein
MTWNNWKVKVVYPNGQRVVASSTFTGKLLFAWNEYCQGMFQLMSENEKQQLTWEAFEGMTRFDYRKPLSKY